MKDETGLGRSVGRVCNTYFRLIEGSEGVDGTLLRCAGVIVVAIP